MARILTGGFRLITKGREVRLQNVSIKVPDAPEQPAAAASVNVKFRLGEISFADPVDSELVELAVLDRMALRPMAPNELREAREAASREVLADRLMASTRLPRSG